MAPAQVQSDRSIGFLTVLEHPQFGLFGGYLVLNLVGRPLEFHCTAPVKPNRAQEILYGPTLEPFLYGEQIGQTLLAQAKSEAVALFIDQEPALAVRAGCSTPAALVLPREESPPVGGQRRMLRFDGPHTEGARLNSFELGRNRLAVSVGFPDDRQRIAERLADLPESFDLAEPFDRIREAIEEAQKGVR
jgi:hypothetical protein